MQCVVAIELIKFMITSSGPMCDVCGKYILPLNPSEKVNYFKLTCMSNQYLHCDNACKQAIVDCNSDWLKLPDGPLLEAYKSIYSLKPCTRCGGKQRIKEHIKICESCESITEL